MILTMSQQFSNRMWIRLFYVVFIQFTVQIWILGIQFLLFLQITIQTGWRHLTQLQTRFCVSGALLTTQTTLGRLVRDGSVKAKISAPVFDSQQIWFPGILLVGPQIYRGDLRVSWGGMKFLAKFFPIPYPWGLLTCKIWGDVLSSLNFWNFKNVCGKKCFTFYEALSAPSRLCDRLLGRL